MNIMRDLGELAQRAFKPPQSLLNGLTERQQSARHDRPAFMQRYLKQGTHYTGGILQAKGNGKITGTVQNVLVYYIKYIPRIMHTVNVLLYSRDPL